MKCYNCGGPHTPKRSDALFCSPRCRVNHHRSSRNSKETDNSGKIILSLCDHSGAWSKPYRQAGYDVRQVDIQQGMDVRLFEYPGEIYGVLAAPPCTDFSGAGARWWKNKTEDDLINSLSVVDACLRLVAVCKPKFWVLENPVGRLKNWLGDYKFTFNPCEYGDPYTKKTCLWGDFTPPKPLNPVEPLKAAPGNHSMDLYIRTNGQNLPHSTRGQLRSQTPAGFAQAFFFANQ